MKALILGAGKGSRLQSMTEDKPKPLIRLLGLSLIERVILTAREAGIDEFVIVIGYLGEKIKKALGDGRKHAVKISYVENNEWQKGNGLSVLKARKSLNEPFVLLMADHIFDIRILKGLINFGARSSVVLAVDREEAQPGDTKVLETDGRIADIGKNLHVSNCVDTGMFLCSPKLFAYIDEAVKKGRMQLADGIVEAAKGANAEIFDITQIESYQSTMRKEIKPWWIDIDTQKDLARAKELIIDNASKNPSDALACYVHRPIENKLVAFISDFNITPNQLTVMVNILAYIVAALFFSGYLLPASILSFVVGIADGLDGKLARVKLKISKIGTLEHSFDLLFEFCWFIALSLFLFRSTKSATPLILCVFIILFIAFYRHIYDQFRRAAGKSLDDAGSFERIFKRIAGRRNLYNIPILVSILLGLPLYSLFFILFHSGITAAIYSARAMKHLNAIDRMGPGEQ
ncbi:MAG: NTP transferase domain-containing protein [Planctomycetia bacterium]|nr:NTP transferase domain-containing protein [Planctomycetia bacterium]